MVYKVNLLYLHARNFYRSEQGGIYQTADNTHFRQVVSKPFVDEGLMFRLDNGTRFLQYAFAFLTIERIFASVTLRFCPNEQHATQTDHVVIGVWSESFCCHVIQELYCVRALEHTHFYIRVVFICPLTEHVAETLIAAHGAIAQLFFFLCRENACHFV